MRISTNSMFESAAARINDQQAGLSKIQQQISSSQSILTPADDPIGAAKVLNLSQGQAMNTQYDENRISAKASLSQQEGVLQGVDFVASGRANASARRWGWHARCQFA